MKKRGMALQNVIVAVLTLMVVGIGAKMFVDLSSEPVKHLLGIGNASAFDDAIVQRFNDTKHMNQDAIKSTTGFLFSINRLVQSDKQILDVPWSEANKSFGNVKVIPTEHNLRPLYLGAGGQNPGRQLAKAMIDCWTIFADEANENKYCFVLDTTALESQVTESDLISGFEYLKNEDTSCESACESKITDLLGESWWPWDVENIHWEVGTLSKSTENAIVCADNSWTNEVHIVDRFSGRCELGAVERAANPEQIYMEGFSLPQEISKSSNPFIYTIDEAANAYGDPAYMLYYEQFPDAESKWWHAGSFWLDTLGVALFLVAIPVVAPILGIGGAAAAGGTVVTGAAAAGGTAVAGGGIVAGALAGGAVGVAAGGTAAAGAAAAGGITAGGIAVATAKGAALVGLTSLGVDTITSLGSGMSSAGAIMDNPKDLSGVNHEEIRNTVSRALINPEWAVRKELLLKDLGETVLEFIKEHKEELPEQDSIRIIRDSNTAIINLIADLSGELGEKFLTRTGKITPQGQELFIERINKDLIQEKFNEKTTEKLAEKIKETIEESNTRAIHRSMITAYNIRRRAQTLLKESLSLRLTEESSKEVMKALIKEASDGLNALKPRDMTVIAKGVNDIMPLVITDDGQIIFGEILNVEADRESQKAARTIMAQRLDRIIDSEGEDLFKSLSVFRTVHERLTRNSIKTGSDKVKARNLIAGAAVYYAMKLESSSGKIKPSGVNTVGLKAPFIGTAVYDDQIVEFLGREKLMENFGKDEVHVGLIPEVGEYYLSLTRDQHAYWFDQPPIRFHLVSPCYADMMMRVTRCDCGYSPDPDAGLYQTGVAYPQLQEIYPEYYPDGVLPHFDGTNAMLFRIDENGRPVKDCTPSAWYQFDNLYKPKCIQVNPVIVEDHPGEYNYCYHGNDPLNKALYYTTTAFQVGLSAVCIYGAAHTGPFAYALVPGCAFLGYGLGEYAKDTMGVSQKWPSRGTW